MIPMRNRFYSLVAIAATIILGVVSRRFGRDLPYWLVKWPGDILWATAVYFLTAFIYPRATGMVIACVTAAISLTIEFGKTIPSTALAHFRETTIGGLLLGHVFSWQNLGCYAIGIGLAYAIDIAITPLARKKIFS